MSKRLPVLLTLAALEAGCSDSDADVQYATATPISYPGDFTVDGELEKARAAALQYSTTTRKIDEPWYHWTNDHTDTLLNPNEFADQCFEVTGTIAMAEPEGEDEERSPEKAAAKQDELLHKTEQADRLAKFKKIQTLADDALSGNTMDTLWPVYQSAQTGLNAAPETLGAAVAAINPDTVLCPTDKDYILDEGRHVPVVAFRADAARLALTPDFWSSKVNDCERAGILAAVQYAVDSDGREYTTFPETTGKGTETANLLQSTVAGLCDNAKTTVQGAGTYLQQYYGPSANYELDGSLIYAQGHTKINGHTVTGDFYLQPGNATDCPSDRAIQTITLDDTKSLELHFADCEPDTDLDATLVEGDKRIELASTDVANAPGTYQWKLCTKDDCSRYNLYSLGANDYSWTVEKKRN